MSPAVRAIRGATTVDVDTADHVTGRVQELVRGMVDRNDLDTDDIISILFSTTDDVTSVFPATAARGLGLDDVPLLDARTLAVRGALPRCIRVMMHVQTDLTREKVRHVYLHGARVLRDDLPD